MKLYNTLITAAVSIVLLSLFTTSCSTFKNSSNEIKSVVGRIMVVGAEPFTRLAIQTSSNKAFLIESNDKIQKLLLQNQGKQVKVFFKMKKKTGNGIVLSVVRVKIYYN